MQKEKPTDTSNLPSLPKQALKLVALHFQISFNDVPLWGKHSSCDGFACPAKQGRNEGPAQAHAVEPASARRRVWDGGPGMLHLGGDDPQPHCQLTAQTTPTVRRSPQAEMTRTRDSGHAAGQPASLPAWAPCAGGKHSQTSCALGGGKPLTTQDRAALAWRGICTPAL